MIGDAHGNNLLLKVTRAVSIVDPCSGVDAVSGAPHLCDENVQMAVSVNVLDSQAVTVNDEGVDVGGDPGRAVPGIPTQRTVRVAGPDDYLGPSAGNQLSDGGTCKLSPSFAINDVFDKGGAGDVAVPPPGSDNVDRAVQINVGDGQAFVHRACGGDRVANPLARVIQWIRGDFKQQKRRTALVPRDKLDLPVAVHIAERGIVVFYGARVLDHPPCPGDRRGKTRGGVFPPPDIRTAGIAA